MDNEIPIIQTIILNETQYGVLLGNTLSNFLSNRKQSSSKVQVVKTIFIPSVDNEQLEVRATTNSKKQRYRTSMIFDDVEFVDEEDPKATTIIGTDHNEYHLLRIPINNVDVKVKCTCLDFYYRFATWNSGDDSLIGKPPPPYQRRTTHMPPVNPAKVPGICKHIIKLTDRLIAQRLFR
jgi:hypothetical protein